MFMDIIYIYEYVKVYKNILLYLFYVGDNWFGIYVYESCIYIYIAHENICIYVCVYYLYIRCGILYR